MKLKLTLITLSVYLLCASCSDFVEVHLTTSQITKSDVFSNDVTADAAVRGVYYDLMGFPGSFASGDNNSVTSLAALSADEFKNINGDPEYILFQVNELLPQSKKILPLWTSLYKTIYEANAVLEGLSASAGVSPDVKTQLMGEALFIRAFAHFYLVTLFGDVPLVTSTDYVSNSIVSSETPGKVYEQIIDDLKRAQSGLSNEFNSGERIRINKSAAMAMLARVYLFTGDWANAELQATTVINNADYALLSDLNEVFLKNSHEAIWQLPQTLPVWNTNEGRYFAGVTPTNSLNDKLVQAFGPGDKRLTNWIGSRMQGTQTIFFPFKYKESRQNQPITEYSMVLRLAEQYLVRAEARARQSKLTQAISDLDVIRGRAGLQLMSVTNPGISQPDLFLAIEEQRQLELFTEWGHRWLDLKRTGRALEVLGNSKPGFSSSDELYPIPQDEINKNRNLAQNPGY